MDILLLALIAGFILYRLYRVLGQDVGVKQARAPIQEQTPPVSRQTASRTSVSEKLTDKVSELTKLDPSFNQEDFVNGATKAFEMIVTGFNEGDKDLLKSLLAPNIYNIFEHAIDTRIKDKEVWDNSLIRIQSAVITNIDIKRGSQAFVTVKFVSDQILVTKDNKGQIIEGDPDQIEVLTDTWTFSRDVTSDNPNWFLIKTNSSE